MAKKINWREPEDTGVTKVEISRSATIYGTYSVLELIDATSDGEAKAASNTWVTSYTDSNGLRTHWYKIRFYDGSAYSNYSEPLTSEELRCLCTITDIKRTIDTIGRWTDSEIIDAIDEVEDDLYPEIGTPINAMYSYVGSIDGTLQDTYYVGEKKLHRVDRVFYGTTTKSELFLDDAYKANLQYGMIKILPVASGGPALDSNCDVEIHYVPKIYNRLATFRTCQFLLEKIDFISGGKVGKELEIINRKVADAETLVSQKIGILLSSDFKNYDSVYGVSRKKVIQDHSRNKYISQYNW